MKKVGYILLFLANLALVFLAAWLLGFDILAAANRRIMYIYASIAAALLFVEVGIYEKIHGM